MLHEHPDMMVQNIVTKQYWIHVVFVVFGKSEQQIFDVSHHVGATAKAERASGSTQI